MLVSFSTSNIVSIETFHIYKMDIVHIDATYYLIKCVIYYLQTCYEKTTANMQRNQIDILRINV